MNHNAPQESNHSPSTNMPNIIQKETRQACENCKKEQLECDSVVPCSSCTLRGNANHCSIITHIPKSTEAKTSSMPAKRGYKSHVPSACINCKTAHLACDVSRPCQRCVTLKKTDTCQDMQHKKRGRPKLREKKIYSSNEHTYEILYGTIQTPSITLKNPTRNIVPNIQVPPFKTKISPSTKPQSVISFIHEPIESFQSDDKSPPPIVNTTTTANATATSVPLTYDNLLLESMIPQLTATSQPIREPLLFDYTTNLFETTPLLPVPQNNNNNTTTSSNTMTDASDLTIIMSMEVCCAKVSADTIKCWGYYPQELAHRSFYDFISPKDIDRLARLHRLLLDNVMDTMTGDATLPATERSTSTLFSTTDYSVLNTVANGSRSFSDSIHIKKRSGEYELYKVVVYIGGGLGANLYDITSFSKQYIVAQFRKHEYEVVSTSPPSEDLFKTNEIYNNMEPIAVFSPLTPLSPISPSHNQLANFNKSEPKSFKDSSLLNARKFSQSSIIPASPKFNIAPVTNHPKGTNNLSFQHNKHFSNILQQRFSPSSTPPTSMRLRSTDSVTHPTQQYFLQTSSSTLNAAASAVNGTSRLNKSGPLRTEGVDTNRKMEMSIRSLLC
ncbi:uncharacterized protein EV154DRAFT_483385 [Mucor mucedo]|uniref:uncharacterized protein n=1 Tax=Mucor mucedo TaxID=29922 RepID=UPI00221EAC6A|nr:uncharacterized protein EV154DRAFT_483385 [Mucor mucedo]KAI7889238.1 hypothetical protein EV154DRAFT_483385 [Mucor mucedo]